MPAIVNKAAIRVAGLYLVFAALWLIGYDRVLAFVLSNPSTPDPEPSAWMGALKSGVLVLATALLLYRVLRRPVAPADDAEPIQPADAEDMLREQVALIKQSADKDRLLRLFYDLPFVGMALTSPASKRWLQVNDRLCEMLGYPREELIELAWTQITHPDDLAANLALFQRLTRGEVDAFQFDKRFVRKDGGIVETTIDTRCVRRQDGSLETVVLMVQDISERKRAEAVQREQLALIAQSAEKDRLLRLFYDLPFVGMSIIEPGSKHWMQVNDRLCEIHGYPREELLARAWTDFTHPDDLAGNMAQMERLLAGETDAYQLDKRYVRKDGGIVEVRVDTKAVRNPDGSIKFIVTMVQDVTEHKRAEAEIRTLNERLTELIRVVHELAAARDMQTVIRAVLPAARRLSGADGSTFVLRDGEHGVTAGQDGMGPLWEGRRFALDESISGWAMANRRPMVIRDVYADASFSSDRYRGTFVKSLAIVPMHCANPVGAIGNYWARPTTPSVQEMQLLQTLADATAVAVENIRSYDGLERRVSERTAELEAANKELETFAYTVSHDLKSPLRGIDGFSEILLAEYTAQIDDEGRRLLQRVRKGAQRMGQLIDDLLAYTRMERRAMQLGEVDLPALVHQLLAEQADEIDARGAQVRVDVPSLCARADPSGLAQVLRNLLGNAIKFTRNAAPPVIEIGARREGECCRLWVRDNGMGFDMRYHDRLFEIFQRLNRAEDYPGTGIGLAIVRKAMQRMGGRVWAESELGRGATFYLEIPL